MLCTSVWFIKKNYCACTSLKIFLIPSHKYTWTRAYLVISSTQFHTYIQVTTLELSMLHYFLTSKIVLNFFKHSNQNEVNASNIIIYGDHATLIVFYNFHTQDTTWPIFTCCQHCQYNFFMQSTPRLPDNNRTLETCLQLTLHWQAVLYTHFVSHNNLPFFFFLYHFLTITIYSLQFTFRLYVEHKYFKIPFSQSIN